MIRSFYDIDENEEQDDLEWTLSRKEFIRSLLFVGVASQLPIINACSEIGLNNDEYFKNIAPLDQRQFKIIRKVQDILFPSEGDGPGALEVNADKYLVWVLNDPLLDSKERNYVIKYINQLDKSAKDGYGASFLELSKKEREENIAFIAKESWGKKWLSRILTLIFEALLLDPIYGGNPNNIGWNWLGHHPGQPRPTKEINYPTIIKSTNEI